MTPPIALVKHLYIADGFADDCEELLHRCSKVDFLKYEVFCEIWKEMQLSCVFHERASGAELAELSEELLQVAKYYMMLDTSNFEESVAGLFLVYALLNLQPYKGFAALRIVQEDLPAIERIATVARRDRRHDVLYILGSVLVRGPCQFHASARERGMEAPIKKYFESQAIGEFGSRPKGVFLRQNEELDILRELNSLEKRYNSAKLSITGQSKLDRNLDYTNKELGKELESSLKNIITGIIEPTDSNNDDNKTVDAQSLKVKAMQSKVQPMKHLVGVGNSETTPSKSPTKKTESGKTKTSSPEKSVSRISKKRTIPLVPPKEHAKKKKSRITFESDSDDEEEFFPVPSSDEDCLPSDDSDDDILLDNFHKQNQENSEVMDTTAPEREIDIEIDMLPCHITSEQDGKYIEIEIIDNQNSTKELIKNEVSIKKDADSNTTDKTGSAVVDNIKSTKDTKRDATVELMPSSGGSSKHVTKINDGNIVTAKLDGTVPETKKVAKGSPMKKKKKNTILKSRLNRLGTLAVADFIQNDDS